MNAEYWMITATDEIRSPTRDVVLSFVVNSLVVYHSLHIYMYVILSSLRSSSIVYVTLTGADAGVRLPGSLPWQHVDDAAGSQGQVLWRCCQHVTAQQIRHHQWRR